MQHDLRDREKRPIDGVSQVSLNMSLGKAALLCHVFITSCTLNAPAASPSHTPSNSSPSSHYLVICLYLQSAGPLPSLRTLPWPARGVISHRRLRPGLRGGNASSASGHTGLLLSWRCNQRTMMEIVSQWDCYDTINGAKFDWTDTLQLSHCFGCVKEVIGWLIMESWLYLMLQENCLFTVK